MVLITIREYSKQEGISEQATRKRVSSGIVKGCVVDGLQYIAMQDIRDEVIKDLKAKIKLLNANNRAYKIKSKSVLMQEKEFDYLRQRIIGLEKDLKETQERLYSATDKKEELYEKVITTIMIGNK